MLIPDQVKRHPVEYLTLLLLLFISAFAFVFYSYNDHLQRRIVYISASGYFLWSLYHHHRRGDLAVSIIVEYLVFGLLGVILLTSTLL